MILPDDKRAPPPPYPCSPHNRTRSSTGLRLPTLPSHLLLHIVESTFPPYVPPDPDGVELQRRNLYWLTVSLRLVNRGFYIASMHVLRSTYVDIYLSLIKPPYTSDPFPLGSTDETSNTTEPSTPSIHSIQRETEVLDLFIALKTREDVWLDESDLHLEREDSFNDLFALMQPRCRIEDLLRDYGIRYGCITLSDTPSTSRPAIPFSQLSVSFSTRKVGVILHTPPRSQSHTSSRLLSQTRKTIVECERTREDKLEVVARRLVKALVEWVNERR